LATLITADFRNFLNISSEIWNALFVFALIASVIWLAYSLFEAIKFRDEGGVEKFITSLRDDTGDANAKQSS